MGAAVRERRIQLVNDVAADPRYVKPPAAVDVRAELAVPIVLGEHVLGVLNVESDRPFDQEDATSLQIIADHLAVAIRNARLFESASALAVLEERERLSRDLHDSVTQMLFSVTLVAQSLIPTWRQDPKEGEARADRVLQLSRLALAEMRALIADLRLDVPIHDSLQGAAPGRPLPRAARGAAGRAARVRGGDRRRRLRGGAGARGLPPAALRARGGPLPHRPGGAQQRGEAREALRASRSGCGRTATAST